MSPKVDAFYVHFMYRFFFQRILVVSNYFEVICYFSGSSQSTIDFFFSKREESRSDAFFLQCQLQPCNHWSILLQNYQSYESELARALHAVPCKFFINGMLIITRWLRVLNWPIYSLLFYVIVPGSETTAVQEGVGDWSNAHVGMLAKIPQIYVYLCLYP